MEAQKRVKNPCGEEEIRDLQRDRASKMDRWRDRNIDGTLVSFPVALINAT